MTSILERTISVIAPFNCFLCSKENNILCDACALQVFDGPVEICALCNKPTAESKVCNSCKPRTSLGHVWAAAEYDNTVKQIIHAYKFGRARAAYKPLALAMAGVLPYLEDVLVVHIPTARERVRQRGYDQAYLLAREIARSAGWRHMSLLRRRHSLRQVGAARPQRLRQAAEAFEYKGGDLAGKHILLVDDVTTSGATLSAAAALLARAGAAQVDAVVVAKHTLD